MINLARLHTESRTRDRGNRKQRILTNLAMVPAEVLQKAECRSETEETESREY